MKIDELISELEQVKEEHGNIKIYKAFQIGDFIEYKKPRENQKGIKITEWIEKLEGLQLNRDFGGVIYDPSDGKIAFF